MLTLSSCLSEIEICQLKKSKFLRENNVTKGQRELTIQVNSIIKTVIPRATLDIIKQNRGDERG
jgi:hypothetical protein